ncbi:relaxosome protein TraM [Rahnella victoriana]|uniref:relaxosome protein TraM n=1 Tax=Rahnella victoriana TaxID=1510570 RepID=UPI001E2C9226|nr:relaxosome protein TraM [Rahnella victoriana]UHM93596.1 hypothetical protein J9880_24880 [Rahnella victoriana]
MTRVQTFIGKDTKKKLDAIVRQRSIDCSYTLDINLSNTAAMLIDLGIRTYHQERQQQDDKFDQGKYNEILLEHVMMISLIMQHLARNLSLDNMEVSTNDPRPVSLVIDARVKETLMKFFPLSEEETMDKIIKELS